MDTLRPAALLPLCFLAACAAEVADASSTHDDVEHKASVARDDYARMARTLGLDERLCPVLEPLARGGMPLSRMGMVVGLEGEFSALGTMRGGTDIVFDFRNHQMAVSNYHGRGLAAEFGGSISGYVGVAFGFRDTVAEWRGHFATIPNDFGMPGIGAFLGASGALFLTGRDGNGDGHLYIQDVRYVNGWPVFAPRDGTGDQILLPPNGVWGVTLAVELGFEAEDLPGLNAFTGPGPDGIWIGIWESADGATNLQYDRLRGRRIAEVGQEIVVRKVDPYGGTCRGRGCVLEFGHRGDSHAVRGFHTANALCAVLGGCTPLRPDIFAHTVRSFATMAIAVGALRDFRGSVRQLCPSHSGPMTPDTPALPPDFSDYPDSQQRCVRCILQSQAEGSYGTAEVIARRCPSMCQGVDCASCLRYQGGRTCAPICVSDACTACLDDGGGTGCLDRCSEHLLYNRATECRQCISERGPMRGASSCIPLCEIRSCETRATGPYCSPLSGG